MKTLKESLIEESLLDNPKDQSYNIVKQRIIDWLETKVQWDYCKRKYYKINKDLTIDVDEFWYEGLNGDFPDYIQFRNANSFVIFCEYGRRYGLKSLRGCPKYVKDLFRCDRSGITTLEGCPERVDGTVDVSFNNLTSLKGAPKGAKNIYCSGNKLTSLAGCPKNLEILNCYNNRLLTLDGCPKELLSLDCSNNRLRTLEGGPKKVNGDFNCRNNDLKNLEGGPEYVRGLFDCKYNQLETLDGGPKEIGGTLYCKNNPNLSEEEIDKFKDSHPGLRVIA